MQTENLKKHLIIKNTPSYTTTKEIKKYANVSKIEKQGNTEFIKTNWIVFM